MKIITFFNNKGGVGKTTLVYHLATMAADLGYRVLVADFDPQCNLSAMCLDEDHLEALWSQDVRVGTAYAAVRPILQGLGDVSEVAVEALEDKLGLVVGDLRLSSFEDRLSEAWPKALDGDEAAFRVLSAFYRIILAAAEEQRAHFTFVDVGPNLGAINRAALIASDYVVTPLAPDLFSMQGLRNLGPTLKRWRQDWRKRLDEAPTDDLRLPPGTIEPAGYILLQAGMRLNRPVQAYQRWVTRTPNEYRRALLPDDPEVEDLTVESDPHCLAVLRHYQSLMPLAQDARKPMFRLRVGDGAIGAHQQAVRRCESDFRALTERVLSSCGVGGVAR